MSEGENASEFIRSNKDEILRRWFEAASKVASARGLERPEFTNIMPKYVAALGEANGALGTFSGAPRKYIESHLATRIRQGFVVEEIVAELGLLREAAEGVLEERASSDAPRPPELSMLWMELGHAAAAAADLFAKHMAEDEQVEKRYLLRLRTLAAAALRSGAPPLRDQLDDVMKLVMEAMGADSATLLLYDAGTCELTSVASVGIAADEDYVASLDIRSFVGKVAATEEPVALDDVSMTRLEIPDALRRSGIQSLLGVRLPERETLTGVVYIGICERRPFNGREAARLELLGEHLTLHLDNAALIEKLEANIAALEEERGLRERFVSVLAHDLRGPLSTAKMAAQLLGATGGVVETREDARRDLFCRLDRNLDRMERMIRDLLDANRIHAGEKLSLVVRKCELLQMAREVVEELRSVHGPRFHVAGDASASGTWDGDLLRRALWNLGVNAAKYGDPDAPITVSILAGRDHAELSVHNEGPPIPLERQEALFRPFVRSSPVEDVPAKNGWGLGLALVRGTAEAHGGRAYVDSGPTRGTTFTIEIPYEVPNQAAMSRR